MIKKLLIILLIIICLSTFILISLPVVDYFAVKFTTRPVFAKITYMYLDGGSYIAYGLGYKICFYTSPFPEITGTDFDFGFYDIEFDFEKVNQLQNNIK